MDRITNPPGVRKGRGRLARHQRRLGNVADGFGVLARTPRRPGPWLLNRPPQGCIQSHPTSLHRPSQQMAGGFSRVQSASLRASVTSTTHLPLDQRCASDAAVTPTWALVLLLASLVPTQPVVEAILFRMILPLPSLTLQSGLTDEELPDFISKPRASLKPRFLGAECGECEKGKAVSLALEKSS